MTGKSYRLGKVVLTVWEGWNKPGLLQLEAWENEFLVRGFYLGPFSVHVEF